MPEFQNSHACCCSQLNTTLGGFGETFHQCVICALPQACLIVSYCFKKSCSVSRPLLYWALRPQGLTQDFKASLSCKNIYRIPNISMHRVHATCTSMCLRPDYPGFNVDWLFVDTNIFDVRQTICLPQEANDRIARCPICHYERLCP